MIRAKGLQKGLQLVESEEDSFRHLEDYYDCPFVAEDNCEGAKDAEFKTRCVGRDFEYRNCRIYQLRMNALAEGREIVSKVSNALTDTVIMSAEDITNHYNHTSSPEESQHDALAEGRANISDFYELSELWQIEQSIKRARKSKLNQRK